MKKIAKIIPLILAIVLILSISSNVMAVKNPASITGATVSQFDTIGSKIIGMIQAVGSIAAVAVLVVLGIKYMMGSTEEKAEYKKTLLPYFIGAILIFAASQIAGIVFNFANSIS